MRVVESGKVLRLDIAAHAEVKVHRGLRIGRCLAHLRCSLTRLSAHARLSENLVVIGRFVVALYDEHIRTQRFAALSGKAAGAGKGLHDAHLSQRRSPARDDPIRLNCGPPPDSSSWRGSLLIVVCCLRRCTRRHTRRLSLAFLPQRAVDRAICLVINFSVSRPSLILFFFARCARLSALGRVDCLQPRRRRRWIRIVVTFNVDGAACGQACRAPLNRLGTLLICADCDHWALGRGSSTGQW